MGVFAQRVWGCRIRTPRRSLSRALDGKPCRHRCRDGLLPGPVRWAFRSSSTGADRPSAELLGPRLPAARSISAAVLPEGPAPAAARNRRPSVRFDRARRRPSLPRRRLRRKGAVFDNLAPLVAGGTRIFGYTLVSDSVRLRARTRLVHGLLNRARVIDNATDRLADLQAALSARFVDCRIDLAGCMALFSALVPGRIPNQQRRPS